MYYRRKIVLALLQLFGGQLEKIHLQKLLFLLSNMQDKAAYNFIPYKYGCYSFTAHADMKAMAAQGMLSEYEKSYAKKDPTDYLKQLSTADLELLQELKVRYGKMSGDALIRHTYLHFPFYAIKSEIVENILSREEADLVSKAKPWSNQTVLFTIGYEGLSLEEYLTRLLKNDVKVLVDVRSNPLSMKYGFSKNQLKRYCTSLDIGYVHMPELGIQSRQRRELHTQSDYDRLFAAYRKKILPQTTDLQINILNLLKTHKRIALTCFEANVCQCHRKHLAEAIQSLPGFNYKIQHI